MSDETAQVEQPAAPAPESVEAALEAAVTAETPAPAFDPESFKSSLTADFKKELDERVKGFQKIVGEKDREIQRLRQPAASDDDDADDRDAQIAALSRRAWILEKRSENSAVADVLLAFSDAADAEEQFKVLSDFAASLTPPPSETKEPEAEEQVAAVDLNNPMPGADEDVTVLSNGTRLTKGIEERVLKNLTRWPGT